MWQPTVDVLDSGAIVLGENIVCDGYAPGRDYRVQTHVHDDHMGEFNRSKGCQDIVLSPETLELLIAEYNADMAYRENLLPVYRGDTQELQDGSVLRLLASNHILGSCQVAVQQPNGRRLGYSGDFGWPLDEVIEVEELVVDSTYGSPGSVRKYTQAQAEARLMEVVMHRLRHGCVHVRAHRGTIERVLPVLGGDIGVPVLASERLIHEVSIYERYGFAVGALVSVESDDGVHAMKQRSYVRLYSKGDGFSNELTCGGTTIVCSAFMTSADEPLRELSDRAYSIALSNHADFNETIDYVKATKAKFVITDNTRNCGQELAIAINQRLNGVTALVSTNQRLEAWP